MGFPGSSAGKESSCNAGDPSSILQCSSWSSLVGVYQFFTRNLALVFFLMFIFYVFGILFFNSAVKDWLAVIFQVLWHYILYKVFLVFLLSFYVSPKPEIFM